MRSSLSQVYKVIQDAVIDTDDMLATNKIIYSQSHVEPAYTASQFIPSPIAAYIGDTRNSSVSLDLPLGNVTVKLSMYGFRMSETDLEERVSFAAAAVIAVRNLSDLTRLRTLSVNIFLTPFRKEANLSTPLTPENVNSGYCTLGKYDREIVVFRKEEWFKVLLHELLHCFDVGPSKTEQIQFQTYMLRTYQLREVSLDEGYIEFLARVLNCMFCALYDDDPERVLETEGDYGRVRALLITKSGTNTLLNGTNSFSYYVLAYLLFSNRDEVLSLSKPGINYHPKISSYLKELLGSWTGKRAHAARRRRVSKITMRMTSNRCIE